MPNTVRIRSSGTASSTPTSLAFGELAINYADGKLFYKNSSNQIVELATGGGGVSDGDKGDIVVANGGTAWSLDTGVVSSFARTLLDDADAATARTTLGAAAASHTHTSSSITDFSSAVAAASPEEVVEFLAPSNFPPTGNASLLYLATDTSRAYRWTGAEYVEVGPSTVFLATHTHSEYLAVAGGTMTGQLVTTAGTASAPGVAFSGDPNCGIAQLGGIDTLGVVTGGVERWRVGSDGATQSVIPGGSTLYPQLQCRAWVNFNGTGTVAIRASGNVSSITDNGVGSYTVNLTTAMPDTNYATIGGHTSLTSDSRQGFQAIPSSASAVAITTRVAGANTDPDWVYAAVFR